MKLIVVMKLRGPFNVFEKSQGCIVFSPRTERRIPRALPPCGLHGGRVGKDRESRAACNLSHLGEGVSGVKDIIITAMCVCFLMKSNII